MKILLFGKTGQLGNACLAALGNHQLVALDRAAADFSQPEQVAQAVMRERPDIVVNACAYTAVDKAESEQALAFAVNRDSVAAMAGACTELGIPCIHVSTDYVFRGDGSEPYRELDSTDPQGVYGQSKLEGEQQLQAANPRHVILRTSWVFSAHGNNFVKTMLRLGRERDQLGVVGDQLGNPTFAGDIAGVIAHLVQDYSDRGELPWGIYHCSSNGTCSWFEFAQEIFQRAEARGMLEAAPAVNRITTADFPTPAKRPAYSVLDLSRLEAYLGRPMPDWREGLDSVLEALAREATAAN